MATEQAPIGTLGDAGDRKAALEQRYIELLEQRIAALELIVRGSDKSVAQPNADSKVALNDDSSSVTGDTKALREQETANGADVDGKDGEKAKDSEDNKPGDDKKEHTKSEKDGEKEDGDANGETKADGDAKDGEKGEAKDDAKKTGKARVLIVSTKMTDLGREDFEIDASNPPPEAEKKVISKFRRVMDTDNPRKLIKEEIEIESAELKKLIRDNCNYFSANVSDEFSALVQSSPFRLIVWAWNDLMKASAPVDSDSEDQKAARQDLTQLLSAIQKSESMDDYFKVRDSMLANKTVRYEHLWTLFPPGTLVYAKPFLGRMQMLEVDYADTPDEMIDRNAPPPKSFRLRCAYFDWDGTRYEKYNFSFDIRKYDGERSIDALEVYPSAYYRNESGEYDDSLLRAELIERGRKFCELCTSEGTDLQWYYKGQVITDVTGATRLAAGRIEEDSASAYAGDGKPDNSIPSKVVDIKGKVVVDNHTFMRGERNPIGYGAPPLGARLPYIPPESSCQCKACQSGHTNRWRDTQPDDLAEQNRVFAKDNNRLMLCPPKVLGFVLRNKLWAQFRVDRLERSDESEDESKEYFEKELQLEENYKDLLLAFVRNHASSRKKQIRQSDDSSKPSKSLEVIEGKGQGLAILLHGPPGVGKTLTAETIALATNRPLLTVSVAEIGIDPQTAEDKLSALFADAARWEAVLLIDEADVFLEERVKTDNPGRNALVSVLLRCLEYYEGIIILTTNRIKSIDIAVQSRMHLAIQYGDLTEAQKKNIYANLLSKIPDSEISNRKELEKKLSPLTRRSPTNGRQIRNIVASAQALARNEERKLKFEDLRVVHEMTVDFLESLKDSTRNARARNEAGDVG